MYHLLPDPVCFLFFVYNIHRHLLPDQLGTEKAENVNSHVSPPTFYLTSLHESQNIPFQASSFSVIPCRPLGKVYRALPCGFFPLYFPLDQPTAIGVSPPTSSHSRTRYYITSTEYSTILISTHLSLPRLLLNPSAFELATFCSPPFPARVIYAGLEINATPAVWG